VGGGWNSLAPSAFPARASRGEELDHVADVRLAHGAAEAAQPRGALEASDDVPARRIDGVGTRAPAHLARLLVREGVAGALARRATAAAAARRARRRLRARRAARDSGRVGVGGDRGGGGGGGGRGRLVQAGEG